MGSLTYISWTTPLLPFVDFKESASILRGLQPVYHADINALYDNKTALDHPVSFDWLPRDTVLPGFEDWYQTDGRHYSAAADPLRISNLDEDILSDLQHALSKVSIKPRHGCCSREHEKGRFSDQKGGPDLGPIYRDIRN